tara:strand:- start:778 stop:1008 length:231 start_codon:yes stop_codon:yes gene_type:complete
MIDTIIIGGQYEDPTEFNGENPKCEFCNNTALPFDEYCEEHQRCYYCGTRTECDCQDCVCGNRLNDEHPMCEVCLS